MLLPNENGNWDRKPRPFIVSQAMHTCVSQTHTITSPHDELGIPWLLWLVVDMLALGVAILTNGYFWTGLGVLGIDRA